MASDASGRPRVARAASQGTPGMRGKRQASSGPFRLSPWDTGVVTVDPMAGLTSSEAADKQAEVGLNLLPTHEAPMWKQFLLRFWGAMPCIIWVSIILELINENWGDFVVLLVLQLVNGTMGFIEDTNANNAIKALTDTVQPKCRVKRDGEWSTQDARYLVPGDLISIRLGNVIPADGIVLETESIEVDQSSLTGEAYPLTVVKDGKVFMGSSVKRGTALVTVTATGKNTLLGQATHELEADEVVSKYQRMLAITTVGLLLVSLVGVVVIFLAFLIETLAVEILLTLSNVIIILVAAIPIATQVVATSTMAVGARLMAARKAILVNLSAMEELAGMSVLCCGKGTLTKNTLTLRDPAIMTDISANDLLLYAALACPVEAGQRDAIDKCIYNTLKNNTDMLPRLEAHLQERLIPFNPADKRATVLIRCPDGSRVKISKGAPQVVAALCKSEAVENQVEQITDSFADRGFRCLGLAISRTWQLPNSTLTLDHKEDKWEMLGVLSMHDPPRDDAKATLERAAKLGVRVKMVTGDQLQIARATSRELGMDYGILSVHDLLTEEKFDKDEMILQAHGFAEVMPDHKYSIVQSLQTSGLVVGMTGDGINDAPAMKRANVGIAVQGASDAAKAAAELVLVGPGLSVVVDAIVASRKIFMRMRNYTIYRIAATLQLLFFFFFQVLFVHPDYVAPSIHWTVFTLPVPAMVLITILNDLTMISTAYDKVPECNEPQVWQLGHLFSVSVVLGLVPCLASLLLLCAALACDASNHNMSWYCSTLASSIQEDGSYYLSQGEMQTVIYLKLAVADFLTLLSARTKWFMFERLPGKALTVAFIIATGIGTILANFWPWPVSEGSMMVGITGKTCGIVWAYNLIWFVIQDVAKVGVYKLLDRASGVQNNAATAFAVAAKLSLQSQSKGKGKAPKTGGAKKPKPHRGGSSEELGGDLDATTSRQVAMADLLSRIRSLHDADTQLHTLNGLNRTIQDQMAGIEITINQLKEFITNHNQPNASVTHTHGHGH